MNTVLYILLGLSCLSLLMMLLFFFKQNQKHTSEGDLSATFRNMSQMLSDQLGMNSKAQTDQLQAINAQLSERLTAMQNQLAQVEKRLHDFTTETQQNLENIRASTGKSLSAMQEDNNKKLDEMRHVVDEKLQKVLTERMNESFKLVSERLEQVYKGLGEMQNLAQGVGDLKKVLSNVKTRGIVGEIQLGAILSEILSPDQYAENIATKQGSRDVVEFAVKLPTENGECLFLPIDAKFPGDSYAHLRDAYENGDKAEIELAAKQLINTVRAEAKDIHDKYIDPPNTTDFAILFLPFEGLYSEVVNRGLVETLQHDYQVNIAGPSTMAALLNSLQMGFRTFAIQKRSGEVWNVLGAVKTEFKKFAATLEATQSRLNQASSELDKLIGVRTRQIERRLRSVTELEDGESALLLSQASTDVSGESEDE